MELKQVAEIVWRDCLAAKQGEKALIVTDSHTRKIADVLLEAGKRFCSCSLTLTNRSKMHGQEPEPAVAKQMLGKEIIVAPTRFSLTHTAAMLRVAKAGARAATLPTITEDMFLRAVPVDYHEMKRIGEELKRALGGKELRVETRAGTDLYLVRRDRKIHNCCGIITEPGQIMNLPDGEVAFAPVEKKAEGRIIIDLSSAPDVEGPFGMIGRVRRPFRITVDRGEMVDCENRVLWKALTAAENGTNLAEFAVGTNPNAKVTGNILEDEKVMATAHVAFGSNKDMGGRVQTTVHLDSVFSRPTIYVDGQAIMKDGEPVG